MAKSSFYQGNPTASKVEEVESILAQALQAAQEVIDDVNAAGASALAAQTSATNSANSATAAAGSAATAATLQANTQALKDAAEAAATAADASEAVASSKASEASASAAAAAADAATANSSVAVTVAARDTAVAAKTAAETARDAAQASQTAAATSATNAAGSASTASTAASTATTKASEASTSASNAATSASTATTKASEASTSASNAATSASTATTKASEASTSATNAATSATNAANSAAAAATFQPSNYVLKAGDTLTGGLIVNAGSAQYPTGLQINASSHATSRRAGITLGNWSFGQDSGGNGTRDFFFFDGTRVPLLFDTTGLTSLQHGAVISRNTAGAYAATIKQGRGVNFGHVLSLECNGNIGGGTDAPRIHFIVPGVVEASWGMDTSGRMIYNTGASSASNGTNRIILAQDGNIYSSYWGDWFSNLFANATNNGNIRVAKTGDTMTGNLQISNTYPQLQMNDTEWGNRSILHDGGQIGFLNNGGGWAWRVDNGGASWQSGGMTVTGNIAATGAISSTLAGEALYTSNGYMFLNRQGVVVYLNKSDGAGGIQHFRCNGTTVGSISVTTTATAYNQSSDVRLKEDFQDPTDEVEEILDNIEIVDFRWKSAGVRQIGVIAQDLYNVEPRAVQEGEEYEDEEVDPETGERRTVMKRSYWGVDYSKLVPHAIQGLQTARKRITVLEQENTILKAQMASVMARLAALEARSAT